MGQQPFLTQVREFLLPSDQDLGPDFLEELQRTALRGLRVACGMAVLAGATFISVPFLLLLQETLKIVTSRLAVVALGVIGLLLCRTQVGQKRPRGLSVFLAMGIGTCLVANQVALGSHIYGHFAGLNTILLVMAALGTLQPFWLLISGTYFLVLYVWAGVKFEPSLGWPPPASFVLPCASLLLSAVISVLLSAVLHRGRRTEFLLRRQLADAFAELQQAQARLLVSEKAVTQSQVVAALSHELNNPLSVLVGNLSTQDALSLKLQTKIASASASASEVPRLLSASQELNTSSLTAAQRMVRLLERLRQFTHLDKAETQAADLNQELLRALEIVQAEVRIAANVETRLNPLPEVLCQPQKLSIAFASLIRNAFQALGENGRIQVSTAHVNQHVEVRIEDNGRGIDPADLKTLFDPKFVSQSGRVRASWGLPTSQQIILQHGGQIELKSTPGKGTIARLILPVRGLQSKAQRVESSA